MLKGISSLILLLLLLIFAGIAVSGYILVKQLPTTTTTITTTTITTSTTTTTTVQPTTTTTTSTSTINIQICSDGTPFGRCSEKRPKYCDNGVLVSNLMKCPCNQNEIYAETNDREEICIIPNICGNKLCENLDEDEYDCPEDCPLWHVLAKGNIKVGIIEFAMPDTKYVDIYYCYHPSIGYYVQNDYSIKKGLSSTEPCETIIQKFTFFDLIHNKSGGISLKIGNISQHFPSFYYIDDWYESEALKYNLNNFSLKIEVIGPIEIENEPPIRGRYDSPEKLYEFFYKEIERNNLQIEKYDVIIYAYFDDHWVEDKGVRFLSTVYGKNIGLVDVSTSIGYTSFYIFDTIVHEIGHIFGAMDKYAPIEGQWQCTEEGIPPKDHTACSMCGSCPKLDCLSGGNPEIPDELMICEKTAEEIGWK